MTARTITLRAELVERLETLAHVQGRTIDDVFGDLLEQYTSTSTNWALALAEGMEQADIDWQDDPSLSARSREYFERRAYEKWRHTQDTDTGKDD